jgi:hypothetical protein
MAKAVGMGGVFLKASDPKKLSAWYAEHLGIPTQDGSTLAFDGPESLGMTVFAHFPESTQYFGGGEQKVMINFRVDDLAALLGSLRRQVCGSIRSATIIPMASSPGSGIQRGIGLSCGSRRRSKLLRSRR